MSQEKPIPYLETGESDITIEVGENPTLEELTTSIGEPVAGGMTADAVNNMKVRNFECGTIMTNYSETDTFCVEFKSGINEGKTYYSREDGSFYLKK